MADTEAPLKDPEQIKETLGQIKEERDDQTIGTPPVNKEKLEGKQDQVNQELQPEQTIEQAKDVVENLLDSQTKEVVFKNDIKIENAIVPGSENKEIDALINTTMNVTYDQGETTQLDETNFQDRLQNVSKLSMTPSSYKLFDFIFPGGKVAGYCRVDKMVEIEEEQILDICNKFKFTAPQPVIILGGLRDNNIETRTPFLEGITRAAYRSDAVMMDSGVRSGIENSALRRNLNIIGVFPHDQIKLPMLNSKTESSGELTNGHTHLFAISDKFYQKWGNESKLKMQIASNISKGSMESRSKGIPQCKMVFIQFGDNPNIIEEIKIAVSMDIPIIVIKGNPTNDSIIAALNGNVPVTDEILKSLIETGQFYACESGKSDDIAAATHFLLTIKPTEGKGVKNPNAKSWLDSEKENKVERTND